MNNQLTQVKNIRFHLGIYAVIEDQKRILLVKKSRGPYQGMWDLPGGSPNHGETIFQTLQREVREETGIQLIDVCLLANHVFVVDYKSNKQLISLHHTCLIYKAIEFDSSQFQDNIAEEDVTGCCWIKKSELIHLPVSKAALCTI